MDRTIESIVIDYLISRQLEKIGNNISGSVPEKTPDNYIVVTKTAGGESDLIRAGMVVVKSISKISKATAMQINESVIKAMSEFADISDEIYSCKLNSDYENSNTITKEYRYNAVFNLYY